MDDTLVTNYMKSSLIRNNCKENMKYKCYIPGAMFGQFSFINVFSGKAVILDAENDLGMKNMVEVAVIVRILQLLYKESASSKHRISIAVLSPYHAQVECMQHKVENHYKNNEFFKVKVGFVRKCEDEKVDILIVSTVGADKDECIEEVNRDQNNISDLFTWPRHCLWILGDEKVHLKRGSIWESLILEAKASRCFFQAAEHKDLAKVIIEVKKDLRQLDELLSGKTTLFRNTTWKILFSSRFRASFLRIESWDTKKLVLLMLLKLSTGWRPKRSSTVLFVSESLYSDIMREFKVRGLHLICTVDIVKETHYVQVLKVWDILPFNEIEELVKHLERIIGTYTPEYFECCKSRVAQRGSELPKTWPRKPAIIQHKTESQCDEMSKDGAYGNVCVENVKVRESLILMKFFPLSTGSVKNMISGCDGGDLGLPFELTEQEKDAVFFDKSSFILGRSGTGKTTVLTMKVFQNEQLHHLACEGFHEGMERNEENTQDVLRQLFVTFNPKLCYAVKQHVDELRRLTCGGSSSSQNTSLSIHDNDKMMFSEDIPDHFVHLSHDVYPLVITFHRFLLMLDGTVGTSYFERFPSFRKVISGNQTTNPRLLVWKHYMSKDVTYERFCSIYWPHFNNKLTKGLDPSLVYTEIMSVIKGGLSSSKNPSEILSRDDYVQLFDKRTSIFNAEKREIIYSIFLKYEKKKGGNEHFDLADLVNDLHRRLEVEGYTGDMMDYVYIDEVQDLSMRQIMLFKYVCSNVDEGFAFSGDTAQAIAKGIGFRFEDIRCMFYKKFLSGSRKGKLSNMFQLSENFRTHAGVLNLAQSVVNLLCHFFPTFVDALSPETSRIGGELPNLLETDINNNAFKIIFGTKGDSSQQIVGFSAEQVVLVRDESLKEKVVDIVGQNSIVLTIMESKGLEFQDVLLYDFFSTSPFSNEWRIIYEYMKEKELLNPPSSELYSSFNMEKHAVLCSELKQLYVAITRTRQRLWICESTGFSEPIYDYWKKLSLVEVKQLTDVFVDNMHIPSISEEWRSRGVKLFHEKNFRMARMCFSKAEDTYSERLSEAYQLRATADSTWASQLERKKLFKDAANLFNRIGEKELAAECLYEMEDYRAAGDMYLSVSQLEKAVRCFYLANRYELAVKAYEQAGDFAKCLTACCDGKLFELGFRLIGQWGLKDDAELEFLRKAALYYYGVKDFKNMMMFVRSFHSKDRMREFLKGQSCFDELIILEVEWGYFEEAGKVSRLKVSHVTKDLHNYGLERETSLIILWHVFLNSRIFQSTEEPFTQKDELLRNAVSFAERDSDVIFYQFVCKEAEILSEGETEEELLKRGIEFVYCYKEFDLAVSVEWVKSIHEIKKIEKIVLDRLRSFLKSVNRLNELQLLDEVRGEFVKASKDDQSLQATSRILWYVFFGSLWAHGQRALPLKNFKQKSELLDAANSFLVGQPDPQYAELLRTEIRVLSGDEIDLSEMCRCLRETPRERSLRIRYLISQRILDRHIRLIKPSEGVLSKNLESVEGLIYFWNYWKDLICELINWCKTHGQDCNAGMIHEDFHFNYFGIRRYDGNKNDSYVVLNTEAHWVKEMHPNLVRNGYLYIIGAREFSSMAARYWCSKLLFVAEKVLRELQSLYASLTEISFSMHLQTKVLISLFEVGKSLQKYKFPYSQYQASLMVDQYCQPCVNHFLGNVFHINWINTLSKEMISLRVNTKSQKGLTCGQLGRIAMILLASKLIGFNDGTEKRVGGPSQNWRDLFIQLNGCSSSLGNGELVISLHNVLKETYSAGWGDGDFMPPACFLYLMDRLLILSFSFRGFVVTTRSSCVDWLAYEAWDMDSSKGCVTSSKIMKTIHHSLASMVIEMLTSQDGLKKWVTRSKEPESSYSALVMRLTVLLSLICANLGDYYYDHLFHLLRSTQFLSLMPSKFHEALTKGMQEDSLVDAVAVACEKINNPFVIMSFTEDLSEAPCHNAIFLNMKELNFHQESVIKVLYPEKCNDAATSRDDHEAQESEL